MDQYTNDNQIYEVNGRQYYCPFELTTSIIISKWKIKIVKMLVDNDKLRYNELKKKIQGDITHKMLTQSLRELESDGIIARHIYSEIPPKVEYSLTELGQGLHDVIEAMNVFGNKFIKNKKSNKKKITQHVSV